MDLDTLLEANQALRAVCAVRAAAWPQGATSAVAMKETAHAEGAVAALLPATHCASPSSSKSLGMSRPMKTIFESRFSPGFQAEPVSEPISMWTP